MIEDVHSPARFFDLLWGFAHEVTYDPRWANGTGYFDNILFLTPTQVCRFTDNEGRRAIVMPEKKAIVVAHERYREREGNTKAIVICRYELI